MGTQKTIAEKIRRKRADYVLALKRNQSGLYEDAMLEQLWEISHSKTILAVCMDKSQKVKSSRWIRIEKHNIGKRHIEILKK